MRRISYSGASFLTADAIADALFQLVTALGISQTTESLNLPAINLTGKPIIVKLIVGPMSELISVPEDSLWDEPNITEVLAFLRDRVHALQQPKPSPAYSEIATTDFDSTDFNNSDFNYSDIDYSDINYSDIDYSDINYSDINYSDINYSDTNYSDINYSDIGRTS